MAPIELVMIILGLFIIGISFFLTEKINDKRNDSSVLETNHIPYVSGMQGKETFALDKINNMLIDSVDDIILNTDVKLSQISNEKIMMVNDFSNQVMEKINQNHQEVIFLYNMLSEKELEIKNFLNQIDKQKNEPQKVSTISETDITETTNFKKNKSEITKLENNKSIDIALDTFLNQEGNNHNDKILKLYNNGISIMEISKQLDIGQGEVKLVVDLFQGLKC